MESGREKMRQIRHLLVLAALLVLALIYSREVFRGISFFFRILQPFLWGGAIAFALNIPMKCYEEKLLAGWKGKSALRMKRSVSIVLSIVSLLVVVSLVVGTVMPQFAKTFSEVGAKAPVFIEEVVEELEELARKYPELTGQVEKLEQLEVDWPAMLDNVVDFLKNGAGDMLSSTVTVASSIISGVVNMVIAFIFALYILAQKERLENQGRRILSAFLPAGAKQKILKVLSMLYGNFSSFLTGQCLEAVILGVMFVICMSIFQMPYALTIGVLIAFTALIPIVGAFIGCGVGAFLILMDNPLQALWFVILFLVLQQIEGNLIYPRVMGNSVGLPAIWILVAVSLGGSLFGIAGMLFFMPLMSTCYSLLRETVNVRNREKTAGGGKPQKEEEKTLSAGSADRQLMGKRSLVKKEPVHKK